MTVPDHKEFSEFNPSYELIHPSELGWVRIADHVWEKPNGERHIFPLGGAEVLVRLKL